MSSNSVTVQSGDTIWGLVAARNPGASNAEIQKKTQAVLDANGETWDSARRIQVGRELDLSAAGGGAPTGGKTAATAKTAIVEPKPEPEPKAEQPKADNPAPTPQNTAPAAQGGNDLLALLEQYIRMQLQTGTLDPTLLLLLGLGGQGGGGFGGLFSGLFGQGGGLFGQGGGLFGQGGGTNPFGGGLDAYLQSIGILGGGLSPTTSKAIGLAGIDPLNARSLAAQTASFTFGLAGGDVLPFANPSVILGNLGITA